MQFKPLMTCVKYLNCTKEEAVHVTLQETNCAKDATLLIQKSLVDKFTFLIEDLIKPLGNQIPLVDVTKKQKHLAKHNKQRQKQAPKEQQHKQKKCHRPVLTVRYHVYSLTLIT